MTKCQEKIHREYKSWDNKIKELNECIEKYEKDVPVLKKDLDKMMNKAKEFKDLMEAEIKKIVEVRGVSEDMASFVANGYANTINEDDLFTNPEGILSINKIDFLKDVVDDDLDTAQKERFAFIVS